MILTVLAHADPEHDVLGTTVAFSFEVVFVAGLWDRDVDSPVLYPTWGELRLLEGHQKSDICCCGRAP